MKHSRPSKKLIFAILILALLTWLFAIVLTAASAIVYTAYNLDQRVSQMKALCESVKKEFALYDTVIAEAVNKESIMNALDFAGQADEIREKAGGKPCLTAGGAVIRAEDGKLTLPKGFPEDVLVDAGEIVGREGIMITAPAGSGEEETSYVVFYSRLDGPLYFIRWTDTAAFLEKETRTFDLNRSLLGIEDAFNVYMLIFTEEPMADGSHSVYYWSDHLPMHATAEEYGITEEMLARAIEDYQTQTVKDLADSYSMLTIEGKTYEFFLQKLKSETRTDSYLAYLIPYSDTGAMMREQILLGAAVFLIIGIVFTVWFFCTRVLVKEYQLNENQKKELSPKVIRRRAFSIIAVGTVVITAAFALLLSLFRLYGTCQQVSMGLLSLQQRVEQNQNQISISRIARKEEYEEYAKLLGQNLEKHPESADKETLQSICDAIQAEYIMLFDSEGRETVSNARYVGLSLDGSSALSDFQRLLTGTPIITKEPAADEAGGGENMLIGVSYGYSGENDRYRALLMAVPADRIAGGSAEDTSDIMQSLVAEGTTAFAVDPQTARITDASDRSLIGSNAVNLGLPEEGLHDDYRDFFKLDGISYYGECSGSDSVLYYYASQSSRIYRFIFVPASLIAAAGALALLAILAAYLLHGYEAYFKTYSEIGAELQDSADEIQRGDGRRKYSKDPSKRWKPSVEEYGMRMPLHMARLALDILCILFIAAIGIKVLSSGGDGQSSLITFILRGKWAKGFNLFSITSILVLLAEVVLAVAVIQLLLRLISSAAGTRGETICRLLNNLTGYVGVVVFVYYSLYYLGFQPGTLLASLGLLSFAVSLGAKDLITDVIAGLSIVFEGEYQVGDIIEVGGYRGEVLEIGVRTTKLEGRGGNIKIISNRDVKNVINMTRLNSWYPLEISIAADQDLDAVEKLLTERLPEIGKSIPEILSGPNYKGIVAMGRGTVTLSIIAECNESDYFKVQRGLNHALQRLFEENGIRIM